VPSGGAAPYRVGPSSLRCAQTQVVWLDPQRIGPVPRLLSRLADKPFQTKASASRSTSLARYLAWLGQPAKTIPMPTGVFCMTCPPLPLDSAFILRSWFSLEQGRPHNGSGDGCHTRSRGQEALALTLIYWELWERCDMQAPAALLVFECFKLPSA